MSYESPQVGGTMEEFDGIMQDDPDGRYSDSSSDFEMYLRRRRQRKFISIGLLSVALILIFAFATSSSSSSKEQAPASGQGGGSNSNTDNTDNSVHGAAPIQNGPITVTPRPRPPGSYQDVMLLKIHEDMSSLGAPGVDSIDMVMEVDMDATIGTPDQNSMQSYQTTVTRFVATINMMGQTLECDTANPSQDSMMGNMDMCAEFEGFLGNTQDYTVNTNTGEVTSHLDRDNDAINMMRLSENPVADNNRIIGLLPGQAISVGDTWDSSIDMGKLGSFQGISTFQGIVPCIGDDTTSCAEIVTTGDLDLDGNAILDAMGGGGSGMAGLDPSQLDGLEITNGELAVTVHWDDVAGFPKYSSTAMNFDLSMSNPINPGQTLTIPVAEEITVTTGRLGD